MERDQIIQEIIKCRSDPVYFIEQYCKILTPDKGLVPFKMYPFQKEIVRKFQVHRNNITNKSRQTGLSTITASYALWLASFHQNKEIIVLSIKDKDAQDFLKKIKTAFYELPEWLRDEPDKDNAHEITLQNGSSITCSPSSNQAVRGHSPALLIIDECAFIKEIEDIWTAALPALSKGGSVILISTPNGIGNFFHDMWEGAQTYTPKDRRNGFEATFVHWTQIPFYRCFDDTEGMTFEEIVEKAKQGNWYKEMKPKTSDRKWNQEFEGDFLGSGNTVVSQRALKWHRKNIEDPILQYNFVMKSDNTVGLSEVEDGDLWIWEKPKSNSFYCIGADVSSGDGSDYNAFQVVDVFTGDQVAEFRGLMNTSMYAKALDFIGKFYRDAYLIPEINGMGYGVVDILVHDLYYHNLYKTRDEQTKIGKRSLKYGWVTTQKTRPLMIQSIQDYVDSKDFKVRSIRLWKELGAFVWKNKKAEADGRNNDDLVMSMCIAAYHKEEALKFLPHGFSNTPYEVDERLEGVSNVTEDGQIIDPYTLEPISSDAFARDTYDSEVDKETLEWLFS
jgi:hypothetical protein